MSIHSCNEFCEKDIRLHYIQKSSSELELGYNVSKEMLINHLEEKIKEYKELLTNLN